MAVARMDKITLYAPITKRGKIMELLQRSGSVEISETALPQGFSTPRTEELSKEIENNLAVIREAIAFLEETFPKQGALHQSLYGKQKTTQEDLLSLWKDRNAILETAGNLLSMKKKMAALHHDIVCRRDINEGLMPWKSLTVPMQFSGTKTTVSWIGITEQYHSYEELQSEYQTYFSDQERCPPIVFAVIHQTKNQLYLSGLHRKKDDAAVKQFLDHIGLIKPSNRTSMLPQEEITQNESIILGAEREIKTIEAELEKYRSQYQKLHFMEDCLRAQEEHNQMLEKAMQTRHVFIINGFVPHDRAESLKYALFHLSAAVEMNPVTAEDNPPVLLENSTFAAPVESVLETYSMPGNGEIDPTGIMAIFYYILFGLMLSDAGYGLIMVLGCAFALTKFQNMEIGLRKTLTMFFYCGISTTFWGIMFGSYFGDVVSVVSATFFHRTIEIPPLWFAPVQEPMRMLMFSMLLGIIHIFSGLGMRLYTVLKVGDYRSAVYDVLCWYLILGGGIICLLANPVFTEMTGLPFTLSTTCGKIAGWIAVIGAVGILLFAGRNTKSRVKRAAKGLYALYGVTGYLSDILSYSRLLALGLATGVIAQVFNKMGSMFGDGLLGFLLFCIIFIIGYSLNMAINLLGAYVHTNRLQFVEFFGKFYQGGGRKFQPFGFHTKYYEFKGERNHG